MITLVLALILVLMIVTNAWMERRISALEQRWDEYIAQQQMICRAWKASTLKGPETNG